MKANTQQPELIKIENDLDLAQAVMRALYYENKGEGATIEEIIAKVQKKYDADAKSITDMLETLKMRYGLINGWGQTRKNPDGTTTIREGWGLIFGREEITELGEEYLNQKCDSVK